MIVHNVLCLFTFKDEEKREGEHVDSCFLRMGQFVHWRKVQYVGLDCPK